MKKKKPKVRQPRITWERKPATQVVPNKKGYKRDKKAWGDDE
jgi:hypothetical protein